MCAKALHTETQVMVKREDEMAFAELNGSYLKFVEDAARLLYEQLINDKRIKDFRSSARTRSPCTLMMQCRLFLHQTVSFVLKYLIKCGLALIHNS